MSALSASLLASATGPALATAAPTPVASVSTLIGMAGSLLLVIGLILLCAWLLKRMGTLQAGGSGVLKLRASLAVGMKERVVLVEAAGETLLLGVSPGGVTCLHRFEGPLPAETQPSAGFAQLLQKQLGLGPRA